MIAHGGGGGKEGEGSGVIMYSYLNHLKCQGVIIREYIQCTTVVVSITAMQLSKLKMRVIL